MNSLLIAANIIKRALKSKKELVALLILPVFVIIVITTIIGKAGSEPTTLGIVDLDRSKFSQELLQMLREYPNMNQVQLSENNYKDAVANKEVSLVIIIPAGFSAQIEAGQKTQVTLYGSDTITSAGLEQTVNQHIAAFYTIASEAERIAHSTGQGLAAVQSSLLNNMAKDNLSLNFHFSGNSADNRQGLISAIGFAIVFIMILIFSTMGTIMEDKKKLTLARMFVSPTKEWEIAAGNLLGSFALGVIQVAVLVIALKYAFHLAWGIGILQIFVILASFLLATIGLGIGLSGVVRENFNPTLVIATIIVPTSILGGCFIPASMLPDIMNRIGYAVPQKWVMDALIRVFNGAGFEDIAFNLMIILAFGLAFATFGIKTLKPIDE